MPAFNGAVLLLSYLGREDHPFHSFLLASLQNFLSTQADRARCLKRGGNLEFVSLDAASAEERYRLEPLEGLTAETVFDARWALTLLEELMGRLYAEYGAQGKAVPPRSAQAVLRPPQRPRGTVLRTSGGPAAGQRRRGQNADALGAPALPRAVAGGSGPHGGRPGRSR
jgi:hypothetical protein